MYLCESVIKPRQSSPEQSENVAKAHNILQIYRPVFDLLGPCSVACMHSLTDTHTHKYRGIEQVLLLLKKRPVEMFS